MPLAEALALAQSRQSSNSALAPIHLEAHDPWADRQALIELAQWCQQFSPLVGLEEAAWPECLLLDLTGLGPLFGGEASLAERAVRAFQDRGLVVRAALAGTIGAAWALARYGEEVRNAECGVRNGEEVWNAEWGVRNGEHESSTSDKADAVCKVLSTEYSVLSNSNHSALPTPHSALGSLPTPHSVLRIPHSELEALRLLPVAALRLSEETLWLLARLGLRRIGQVEALPRQTLLSRFGPELLRRLDQALGRAGEVLLAHKTPPEFVAEWPFETPTDRPEAIDAACEELIRRVALPLSERQQGALRLECRLECSSREAICLTVSLFRPSASPGHLWELLRLRLESVRLPDPVAALRVEVSSTAPLEWEQQELFAPDRRREATRLLSALVDRLSNRLGRQAVLRPAPVRDAQPEHACVYFPLSDGAPAKAASGAARASRQRRGKPAAGGQSRPAGSLVFSAGQRPLWLRRALPLPASRTADRPPQAFRLSGQEHRLVRCWGPERIETGWWRSGIVRRDYYRVETTAGSRFWLFRELGSGQWFLQGEFE